MGRAAGATAVVPDGARTARTRSSRHGSRGRTSGCAAGPAPTERRTARWSRASRSWRLRLPRFSPDRSSRCSIRPSTSSPGSRTPVISSRRGTAATSARRPCCRRRGRLGAAELHERCHLTQAAVAFLAVAGLRPVLTTYFAACRALVDDGAVGSGYLSVLRRATGICGSARGRQAPARLPCVRHALDVRAG